MKNDGSLLRNPNNSANIEQILDEYKNIHEIDVKKNGFFLDAMVRYII